MVALMHMFSLKNQINAKVFRDTERVYRTKEPFVFKEVFGQKRNKPRVNVTWTLLVDKRNYQDALKTGAEAMFIDKYGDVVTVYKIGDVSIELCGGPHVSNTKELGKFKITKEEASSAGVRRIKAILE